MPSSGAQISVFPPMLCRLLFTIDTFPSLNAAYSPLATCNSWNTKTCVAAELRIWGGSANQGSTPHRPKKYELHLEWFGLAKEDRGELFVPNKAMLDRAKRKNRRIFQLIVCGLDSEEASLGKSHSRLSEHRKNCQLYDDGSSELQVTNIVVSQMFRTVMSSRLIGEGDPVYPSKGGLDCRVEGQIPRIEGRPRHRLCASGANLRTPAKRSRSPPIGKDFMSKHRRAGKAQFQGITGAMPFIAHQATRRENAPMRMTA
ncbi:hypothetical protein BD410DRAFT_860545 [Rickenella mellea]|uniref:Uncharacterized protein n=1 Tax=Rickenella mellea TaxID=50990 RepID=A0A4Y7Q606_9AGAM|nr:hypothetical protein BD410DRAFT_860545 [Rickenella mellea]